MSNKSSDISKKDEPERCATQSLNSPLHRHENHLHTTDSYRYFHANNSNRNSSHKSLGSFDRMDSWRSSLNLSLRENPQSFDDIESEIVAQAGDMGDRALQTRSSTNGSCRVDALDIENIERWAHPSSFFVRDSALQNNTCPTEAVLPSLEISRISPQPLLFDKDKGQTESKIQEPSHRNVPQYENEGKHFSPILLHISTLVHLAVFGIFGVLTRYSLQKLFGPDIARVTSDHTFLYLDLPSNMVGSFLMGWLGIVFKNNICEISNLLAIGLTTGFLGSLTTFSGWMQKMLDLAAKGQWTLSVLGLLIGTFLAVYLVIEGVRTAKGFQYLLLRFYLIENDPSFFRKWRVDSCKSHLLVLLILCLLLGGLLGMSIALYSVEMHHDESSAPLWLACLVSPLGVWLRWYLARLNGRGLGRKGHLKWIPFGTLFANVIASSIMASLATAKEESTQNGRIIIAGVQFGLLGCLSTVSTFVAEVYAMRQSDHPWRADAYITLTIVPSFVIGTLVYLVPKWTKGYE